MATHCIARSCPQLTAYTSRSAARAFLRLAPGRYLHNSSVPVLDFLLPSLPSGTLHHIWATEPKPHHVQKHGKRQFTFSARRQETMAIFNPRKDEEGKDMNIEITPRASHRLKEIMAQDQNPNLALRISVESGGCHGFQYLMSLTTLSSLDTSVSTSIPEDSSQVLDTSSMDPSEIPPRCTKQHDHKTPNGASSHHLNTVPSTTPSSSASPNEEHKKDSDTKTTELSEDDTVFATDSGAGAKVVIDLPSLELLKGSKVDYTMELIGSQFKIVDNPSSTSSCGCGTSFDIKT